jgi:LuxR family maltose regulon positive regulatory protein
VPSPGGHPNDDVLPVPQGFDFPSSGAYAESVPVQAETAPTPPLIWTKLHAPVRRGLVSRGALVDLLCTGPPRKLTVVRAPAGWGKSTLLADWHASEREARPFAWLALDQGDDDPVRFWTYAIEALRTLDPEIGISSVPVLQAPGVRLVDHALPVLVNEITTTLRGQAVLVVDDYHLVRSAEIHEGVAFLVENAPPTLELVLAGRSEPPLPLARLRAKGQLLEIGSEELRFSPAEADALLNDLHGLELAQDDVVRLRDRTEGWAAGLYLAALSLRGRSDAHAFVAAFAGDDRHLVDYLSAEVLAGQPERVRRFLLWTSVVERLSAPLCDAVMAGTGSVSMLEDIERSNFFLVPLDSKRQWYRYHHLFGELLRHELAFTEPEVVPVLHRRAAAWLLDAGFVSEGIHHAIAAGDLAQAGELIAQHWAPTLLGTAGDRTVDSWLSALPDNTLRADFRLCFARCFIGLSLGRMDEVEKWLVIAESAPLPQPFRDGVTSVPGALACVRAAFLWETGDAGGALEEGRKVLAAETGPWRAIGVAVIGLAHAARAEWEEGMKWMAEYARIGRETGHHVNNVSGLSTVSACHAELGQWEAAADVAQTALALGIRHGINEHWCSAHAHLARGLVLERGGELEEAEAALERSVELARRGAGPVSVGWPLLHLARVHAGRGDRPAARARLDEAQLALASARDAGIFPERLARARRQVSGHGPTPAITELSERELAVLRLLATPLSQREIAAELYVSLNTVKTHTKSLFRKLGVSSRAEAVAMTHEIL